MFNIPTHSVVHDFVTDEVVSGAVLQNRAISLAEELFGRSETLGRTYVFILVESNTRYIECLFATWNSGRIPVCLSPSSTNYEIRALVQFLEPEIIVCSEPLVKELSSIACAIKGIPNEPIAVTRTKSSRISNPPTLDDDALVLFSSGTTGHPKGVVHSFRSLLARISINIETIGPFNLSESLCVLPLHFGHGLIGNCLTPILAGANLHFGNQSLAASASQLPTLLDDNDITFLSSVPAFWRLVAELTDRRPKSAIKRVHVGSSPLGIDLWNDIVNYSGTANVFNTYGITEAANWISGCSFSNSGNLPGVIGKPWGGSFNILSEDGSICNHGEGELLVLSPSAMACYINSPDLTKGVFRDGWLLTGDLAELHHDGTARLVGRKSTEINRGGEKINPEEIELALDSHGQISDSCCFGIEHPILGQQVAVAIVRNHNESCTEQDVIEYLMKKLRENLVPESIFFLETIQRSDRGKIDRSAVINECLSSVRNSRN